MGENYLEDKLPVRHRTDSPWRAYLGWQAASLPSPASCRTSFVTLSVGACSRFIVVEALRAKFFTKGNHFRAAFGVRASSRRFDKHSAHETHEGHEQEKPIPKLSRLFVRFVGKKFITERGAARIMAA